jgi:predicted nucleic acid-binding protein
MFMHSLLLSEGFLFIQLAELGGKLRNQHRTEGVTLQLPDALITATALVHGFCLATFNIKHYPMPQLKLYQAV